MCHTVHLCLASHTRPFPTIQLLLQEIHSLRTQIKCHVLYEDFPQPFLSTTESLAFISEHAWLSAIAHFLKLKGP